MPSDGWIEILQVVFLIYISFSLNQKSYSYIFRYAQANHFQLVSGINLERTVKLTIESLTLTRWLRDCDITEFPKAGDVRGEVSNLANIIYANKLQFTINAMENDRLVRLSYRNCRIQIDPPLIFTRFFFNPRPVVITMSNFVNLS